MSEWPMERLCTVLAFSNLHFPLSLALTLTLALVAVLALALYIAN